MVTTKLGVAGVSRDHPGQFTDKALADAAATSILIDEFDTWQPGYAGAIVRIFRAGTTELAAVYKDLQRTQKADNPQRLITREDNLGRTYGKFIDPIYTDTAYYLDIDAQQQTGVQRPGLTTLRQEDASEAVVTAKGGEAARQLREIVADTVHALNYGPMRPERPAVNTATIQAAIGAASNDGGGVVRMPPGTYAITSLTVPQGVLLAGQGQDATMLQSEDATRVVTVEGDDGGLMDMTLDGVQLTPGSTGVWSRAIQRLRLYNVRIGRFDVPFQHRGGDGHEYRNLHLNNTNRPAQFLGDSDPQSGDLGAAFERLDWLGGVVSNMTGTGVDFSVINRPCRHHAIRNVLFRDNVGSEAVFLNGPSHVRFEDCAWRGNFTNLTVRDSQTASIDARRLVDLHLIGGSIEGGENVFDGTCRDVRFERMRLEDVTWNLNVPENPILVRDSQETGGAIKGASTKLTRMRDIDEGYTLGSTTDGANVLAWETELGAGEVIHLNVFATALQTDADEHAVFHVEHAAQGGAATLNWDGQTSNFTVGETVKGQTSGASGIIQAQTDNGTSGSLTLIKVAGSFVDNETIQEIDNSGEARVNGTESYASASLLGSKVSHKAQKSTNATNWDVVFAVSNRKVQVAVSGDSGDDIDWVIRVEATR